MWPQGGAVLTLVLYVSVDGVSCCYFLICGFFKIADIMMENQWPCLFHYLVLYFPVLNILHFQISTHRSFWWILDELQHKCLLGLVFWGGRGYALCQFHSDSAMLYCILLQILCKYFQTLCITVSKNHWAPVYSKVSLCWQINRSAITFVQIRPQTKLTYDYSIVRLWGVLNVNTCRAILVLLWVAVGNIPRTCFMISFY